MYVGELLFECQLQWTVSIDATKLGLMPKAACTCMFELVGAYLNVEDVTIRIV